MNIIQRTTGETVMISWVDTAVFVLKRPVIYLSINKPVFPAELLILIMVIGRIPISIVTDTSRSGLLVIHLPSSDWII